MIKSMISIFKLIFYPNLQRFANINHLKNDSLTQVFNTYSVFKTSRLLIVSCDKQKITSSTLSQVFNPYNFIESLIKQLVVLDL